MSGGKGGGSNTATTSTELPQWVTDQAQANLAEANTAAAGVGAQYGGERVAGLNPQQTAAYNYINQNYQTAPTNSQNAINAISGNNLVTTATGLLNPYLANVESDAVNQVQRSGALQSNALAANAENVGAFGGNRYAIQQGVLGGETARQSGEIANTIRSQGWDTAVQQAIGQAGAVVSGEGATQQQMLAGASAEQGAGQQQQNQQQAEDTAAWQAWQQQQDVPLQQLAIRQSALSSTPYGTSTTSSQPLNSSPITSALGGAASGAALGTAIMPGWGTAIGAGVGGLSSFFH